MADAQRSCWIEKHDGQVVLHLGGAWRLGALRELSQQLIGPGGPLQAVASHAVPRAIDGAALQDIDTAAALLLLDSLADAGGDPATVALRNFDARLGRVFEVVRSRFAETTVAAKRHKLAPIARVGQISAGVGTLLLGHVEFFGRTLVELSRVLLRPHTLRVHELFAQLGQVGVNAIPVVALVTFLIGVVMAYMLGLQAEKYGANIFVVDGVALGITREFSPLIVATIMAGRSGAAFTAQLGTMKLTEEIDAIRTLGLSAPQVLVVPRVLALVLTLPLLVFVGNVAGLAGAMVMSNLTLDITPQTFMERLHVALAPRHYVIGLGKSPVFALFIAIIGCRMGLSVSRDTRSIGINTTSTVVQGIVAVILLDAMFAVIFQELDL
ncbi:MAG: ABC transporter permease [Burkholderiaceae bacterium]|nr:ABC transporter permease [Burkholderiaceae bacterium]